MERVRGDDETRAKAAPLKALDDHTRQWRHQPFRGRNHLSSEVWLARRSPEVSDDWA
jgi:hypothetical protein